MSPMFLVADEIKAGRLVAILQEFLQEEHAINAIYPHRQHVPAKVRSFIDLSIRYFREHPTWAQPCEAQEIDWLPELHAEQAIGTARRCATSASRLARRVLDVSGNWTCLGTVPELSQHFVDGQSVTLAAPVGKLQLMSSL
jgi:hypothetical protein